MRATARVIGLIWFVITTLLALVLAPGLWALIVYYSWNWGGFVPAFIVFWLGGGLAFGIVNVATIPIRAIGGVLMAFGEEEF